MSICIPKAHKTEGWLIFANTLEKVIPKENLDPWTLPDINSFEPLGGTERLITRSNYETKLRQLSEMAVFVSFSNFDYAWEHLIGDLDCVFSFSSLPTISPLGGNSFLIKCSTKQDADLILSNPTMITDGCKVEFSKWSLSKGTITPFRSQERWVELIGMPVHLMNSEVINDVCAKFGTVKEYRVVRGVSDHFTCVQIRLSEVNIFNIPQFVSLVGKEATFVVRVSMSLGELYPKKQTMKNRKKKAGQEDSSAPLTQHATTVPSNAMHPVDDDPTAVTHFLNSLCEPPQPIIPENPPTDPDFPPLTHTNVRVSPPNSRNPVPLSPSFLNLPPQPQTLLAQPTTCSHANLTLSGVDSCDPAPNSLSTPINPSPPSDIVCQVPLPQSVPTSPNSNPNSFSLPTQPWPTLLTTTPSSSYDPTEEQIEDDDCFPSDSGEESDHCPEALEPIEELPQGADVAEFITKKLEVVKKVLADVEAKRRLENKEQSHKEVEAKKNSDNSMLRGKRVAIIEGHDNSTPRIEQGDDQAATNLYTSEALTTKKVRKLATRSARRRKRGALLLQTEELHLEST